MVLGPASVAVTAGDGSLGRLTLVAAVFGAVVGAVILAVGRVSGANINPAVTLGVATRDRRLGVDALAYLAAQAGACLVAGLVLRALFAPDLSSGHLGSTMLGPSITLATGFALEVLGTFALAFAALSVGSWTRTVPLQAATVRCVLFILILILGPLTGASFNPARSAGPALAAGFLDNVWLYLFAPVLGGVLAGEVSRKASSRSP